MADTSEVKALTDRLENGIKNLYESEKYAAYLKTMSRFHQYSTRNTLLIHMQMPDATRVAGYNFWKHKLKRQVKKGEHGIKILAPTPKVITKEMEKIDPDTQRPVIGEDGQPVLEHIEIRLARFKVVPVFDVSQTEGEPLPSLVENITGDVAQYELFLDALRAVSPLPISFEDLPPEKDGLCYLGERICIRNGMSEIQTFSALIHEMTHAKLHDLQVVKENGEEPKDRRTEEVEAESVSYAVSQYYGIETGANSFGYIAEWSRGRELKELNASLDTIRKAAAELIDGIDEKYRALAKERGIDLSASNPRKAQDSPVLDTPKQDAPAQDAPMQDASAPETLNTEPAPSSAELTADQLYFKYANIVADRAVQFAVSSGTLSYTDEAAARRACDQIVRRVVSDLLLELGKGEAAEHYSLFSQYMDNTDFRGRLEDYAFIRAYLEPVSALRDAKPITEDPPTPETPIAEQAPESETVPLLRTDVSALIEEYARNAAVSSPSRVGSATLMTPVFSDGNFNREGKKIFVGIEEPAGKYQLFSRVESDNKVLYLLTASGMIDNTRQYFQDEYNEETHKWENHWPTEAELDEVIPLITERFERDMANPAMWAKYQHAAILNRLAECDAHNEPVRKLRDEESKRREAEAERERQEEQRKNEERFDARVDEIAGAMASGMTISVGYDEYAFDGKNPVLDLFKLYGIELPLRTQGWVNTGLAAITDSGYRYYKSKHKGDSTTFGGYLKKLREAIQAEPIERKRQTVQPESDGNDDQLKATESNEIQQTAAPETEARHTVQKGTLENKLFERFAAMFPDFASGKYSYMQLESDGFEPLSLEWVFGDRISVMHTYAQDGDLCYDPMMEFRFNNIGRTMSACMFQQSIPSLYQYFDDDGVGMSVDGNGKSKTAPGLKEELNGFAEQWFDNIENQGYLPVKANLVIGEDNEVRITFDEDGNPIMPEPGKTEKQYDLGYGYLGNGITVWNRAEETNGDYATVAHIAPDRTVTIYDLDMPHEVRQKIDIVANSPDTKAFGFSPAPENTPPHIDGAAAPASVHEAVKRALPETANYRIAKMPDPTVTIREMKEYGYGSDDMIPLSESCALQFYDSNMTVYLLNPDGTEAVAFDRDDIIGHGGLFGIDKGDWECSPEYAAKLALAERAEKDRETDLLHGDDQYHRENKFGIYQVRDDLSETRDFCFVSMGELEALDLPVERRRYELVYTAPFSERVEFLSDRYPVLNKIYQDFNVNHPDGYAARSVSVSDVIVLRCNGDVSAFYVDSAGFRELEGFFGNEKQQETTKSNDIQQKATTENNEKQQNITETNNGKQQNTTEPETIDDRIMDITVSTPPNPELARLESEVKAGRSISIMDLSKAVKAEQKPISKGKPSLLARLEEAKREVEQNRHPAAANKKERGHE